MASTIVTTVVLFGIALVVIYAVMQARPEPFPAYDWSQHKTHAPAPTPVMDSMELPTEREVPAYDFDPRTGHVALVGTPVSNSNVRIAVPNALDLDVYNRFTLQGYIPFMDHTTRLGKWACEMRDLDNFKYTRSDITIQQVSIAALTLPTLLFEDTKGL